MWILRKVRNDDRKLYSALSDTLCRKKKTVGGALLTPSPEVREPSQGPFSLLRLITSTTEKKLVCVANSPNPRPKMIKQPESNSFGPREIVSLIMGRM